MEIFKSWIEDIPQQFQGKERISILIGAFAKQMDEVMQVFSDLEIKTSLEIANGQNLDYTGNIATMSRKDAHIVLRKNHNVEITDDVYRKVILWKLIKNTSDCTYEDIMGSMSILWNTDNISYVEDPKRPATILLKMPTTGIDSADPVIGRILSIKPGGVGIIYNMPYYFVIDSSCIEKMFLISLWLHWRIPFWDCYILDGSWLLDGSIQLCQKRRYDLRIGLKYYEGIFYELEAWHTRLLDGTWNLDGSNLLDAKYRSFGLRIYEKIENENKAGSFNIKETLSFVFNFWHRYYFDGVSVKTHIIINSHTEEIKDEPVDIRRNLWFLDESQKLDGTKILNAAQRKEALYG